MLALGWALVGTAGLARAQSCSREGDFGTRCRLTLSQPRTFTLEARAIVSPQSAPHRGAIAISVDGQPCPATQSVGRKRLVARCPVALSAAEHVIAAQVGAQETPVRDVVLFMRPNARLASLPREAGDLYPKGTPASARRFRLWPF